MTAEKNKTTNQIHDIAQGYFGKKNKESTSKPHTQKHTLNEKKNSKTDSCFLHHTGCDLFELQVKNIKPYQAVDESQTPPP